MPASAFRWHRAVAIAMTALFFAYWTYGVWNNYAHPPGVDFVSFWAAGRLGIGGNPALAYDLATHRALELTAGKLGGLQPFPYPPPFLFFVIPFALGPFWLAFAAWVGATATVYFAAFRRIAPWPYTFAHPANLTNAVVAQNGMLTAGIFAGGFALLERRPIAAGALFGLLVIKPQLAVLIPIALFAGRHWKALGTAAASAIILLALSYLAFGLDTWRGFFEIAAHQASLMSGRIPWPKIASIFGALRMVGAPLVIAITVHVAVAVGAAIVTWLAWSRRLATRVPIIGAASLLISPYLFNHDSLLLMLPIGWLIVHRRRPIIVAALWWLSLIAIGAIGPNPTPIAAIIAIAVMWQEAKTPVLNREEAAAT